ncbi:hypothetical protein ES708_15751 [subsurface metagenome]
MHSKSARVKDQRERLATASRHYASLTPVQRARLRHQMRFVSRVGSGSVSEEVLLQGRQLFISEDIRELKTKQKLLSPLFEVCIVLCDKEYTALSGNLWLYYWIAGEWHEIPGQELATGNWLFSRVPPGQAAYRVYGEADGYFDPEFAQFQSMDERQLKQHHAHLLYQKGTGYIISFGANTQNYRRRNTARINLTSLHIFAKISFFEYSGRLDIALFRGRYSQEPVDEIGRRHFSVRASEADPKYYDAFFRGFYISKDSDYTMYFYRFDPPYPAFSGFIGWKEFP